MANEALIANQEHYKELNNTQITFCQSRIADLQQQIVAYGQAIDENNQNITTYQEQIAELEASNLGVDETIKILETA